MNSNLDGNIAGAVGSTAGASAPDDVLNALYDESKSLQVRKNRIEEEASKTAAEAEKLQLYIYDNANPSPLIVTIMVLAVILVIWLLYIFVIKASFSGEWHDEKNNVYHISHNRLTNNLNINGVARAGYIIDNAVVLKEQNQYGIWDYANSVFLIDGGYLKRLIE